MELEDLGASPQNLGGVSSGEEELEGTQREPADPLGDTDGTRNLEHGAKLQSLEDVSDGDEELGELGKNPQNLEGVADGARTLSAEEILGSRR